MNIVFHHEKSIFDESIVSKMSSVKALVKYAKIKSLVVATLLGMGLFHFVCVLIYTLPNDFLPETALEISSAYVNPVFHQGWQLFAPDVVKDQFESRIRYQLNGAWTDWEDAEAIPGLNWNTRVQNMSQKYLQVLGGDLRKNLTFTDEQPNYDLILTYRPYNQWLYYSVKRLEYVLGARPESVQIELLVLPTNGWDGDSLPNRSFVFPVFNVLENRHVE